MVVSANTANLAFEATCASSRVSLHDNGNTTEAKERLHRAAATGLLSSNLSSPLHPAYDMTVTKAELTRDMVEAVGLTLREAKVMVDAFFSEIAACLIRDEEVKLSDFRGRSGQCAD